MQHHTDIVIFTDGACSGNPGPGGWGAIIYLKNREKVMELGGGESSTTNNRMELTAAIAALRAVSIELGEPGSITLYSDSKYVIDGITQWIHGWKQKDWKKADKKEVLNRDLWEALDALVHRGSLRGRITWKYVAGHSNNPGNDRCDRIAVAFSKNVAIDLYQGGRVGYKNL